MAKIWSGGASEEKHTNVDDLMVGEDLITDREFVQYEALTLLAYHVQLQKQKLIDRHDGSGIISSLLSILKDGIDLKPDLEDVHGNVEDFVINNAGDSGKNLRIFLSRNEQIHTDILLYGRKELLKIAEMTSRIVDSLLKKRDEIKGVMPGYTHYRQGMVITLKTYFDYFASIFKFSAQELQEAANSVDTIPFGYGSGFGSLSDVDFQEVSKLLGLEPSRKNPQYLSLMRGMDEIDLAYPLLKLLLNISRISQDLIMFSGDEIPVFVLPDGFVSGSSLMANKRNPDFLELVQGYTSEITGNFNSLVGMIANKSSGYHRDFQISKKLMVGIFRRVKQILNPLPEFFSELGVNPGSANLAIKNTSYATANAKAIFKLGSSWKDSYSKVGKKIKDGEQLEELQPEDIVTVSMADIIELQESIASKLEAIDYNREQLIARAKALVLDNRPV